MRVHDLALIGFGGVNQALAALIARSSHRFERLGFRPQVTAVVDQRYGTLVRPEGIDLHELLARPGTSGFAGMPGGSAVVRTEEVIRTGGAGVIVEATTTDAVDGEPAASHVRWALERGANVATTNKGPIAWHGAELRALAAERGAVLSYEGTVMSGTPLLGLARRELAGSEIHAFEGILNGTSNHVLQRMAHGASLDDAIAEAQRLGYAEADPTADLNGSDVQLKVAILASETLGGALLPSEVDVTGIGDLGPDEVARAALEGFRVKLVGSARRHPDGSIAGSVGVRRLAPEHPLAGVPGAENAVTLETDLLGALTVRGPGAGRVETAAALVSDLIRIDRAVSVRSRR